MNLKICEKTLKKQIYKLLKNVKSSSCLDKFTSNDTDILKNEKDKK